MSAELQGIGMIFEIDVDDAPCKVAGILCLENTETFDADFSAERDNIGIDGDGETRMGDFAACGVNNGFTGRIERTVECPHAAAGLARAVSGKLELTDRREACRYHRLVDTRIVVLRGGERTLHELGFRSRKLPREVTEREEQAYSDRHSVIMPLPLVIALRRVTLCTSDGALPVKFFVDVVFVKIGHVLDRLLWYFLFR